MFSKSEPIFSSMELDENELDPTVWPCTYGDCEEEQEENTQSKLSPSEFDVNIYFSPEFLGQDVSNTQSLHDVSFSNEASIQPESLNNIIPELPALETDTSSKMYRPILPASNKRFDPLSIYRSLLQEQKTDEYILDYFLQNFYLIMQDYNGAGNEYQNNTSYATPAQDVHVAKPNNEVVDNNVFASQIVPTHSQQTDTTFPRIRAEEDYNLIFKEEDLGVVSVNNFDYFCGYRIFKELKKYIEKQDPSLDIHFQHDQKKRNTIIFILNRYPTAPSQSPFGKLQKINLCGQFVSQANQMNQSRFDIESITTPSRNQNSSQGLTNSSGYNSHLNLFPMPRLRNDQHNVSTRSLGAAKRNPGGK